MSDWQARLVDDGQTFMQHARRLIIFRRHGELVEQVIGFEADGRALVASWTTDAGRVSEHPGFLIPAGAVEDLTRQLDPGPTQAEVTRLEEALAIERRRVDDTLAHGRRP